MFASLRLLVLAASCACVDAFLLPHHVRHAYHHHRARPEQGPCYNARPPFGIDDGDDDRLIDIRRALRRMQSLQDHQGSVTMEALQKRIGNLVARRDSSVAGAGQGMFAVRNIKAGCIVGFYPVHGIGVDFNDISSVCCGATLQDQQYFDHETANEGGENNYVQYLLGSRKIGDADFGNDATLFVNVNPDRLDITNDGWISHYINDGATVTSNSESGMVDYYAASLKRKNCVNIPFGPAPLIATVTTRKIKKGEELFTSYGCLYWIETVLQPGEICQDVTEAVQIGAKQTAQDLFVAMQGARTTYANQQSELEKEFARMT